MRHPENKCDHERNRKKLCAPCGKKIVFGQNSEDRYLITRSIEKLIAKYINKHFSIDDLRYPLSICTDCRIKLTKRESDSNVRLKSMPKYETILLPNNNTRLSKSSKKVCECFICTTARFKGHVKKKRGKKTVECSEKFTTVKAPDSQGNSIICKLCFNNIAKGVSHKCISNENKHSNSKKQTENVIKLVNNCSEKTQEMIANSILQKKIKNQVDVEKKVTLSSGGRKRKLNIGKKEETTTFSLKKLDEYKVEAGCSARSMKKLTKFIRSSAGRKSVPVGYEKHLSEKSKELDYLYKVDSLEFDVTPQKNDKIQNKKNVVIREKRPVVWADTEKLIETIIDKRKIIGNYEVKVMADGGQSFFKICASIFPENYLDSECDDNSDNDENTGEEKDDFEIGLSLPKKLKPSDEKKSLLGVCKLFLLCIVPQIKETYANLKLLFDLIKLNEIYCKFVSDFKVVLIINGQQTATSTFPCPYCFITLKDLENYADLQNETNEIGELKTYGDLKRDNYKFKEIYSQEKKFAKNCNNSINPPLFEESDDTSVLKKCIIPELHIMQGIVNHLFWKGLVCMVGREKALSWPKSLNIVAENYHGEVFDGNSCRRLLKEADKIFDSEICENGDKLRFIPIVETFKALNKIVECCFSVKKIDENVHEHIKRFKKVYLVTKISETLKVHVLVSHLEQCLKLLNTSNGLGIWSEQAGEAIHREFLKYWSRYNVRSLDHPSYPRRLLSASVEFSSEHI